MSQEMQIGSLPSRYRDAAGGSRMRNVVLAIALTALCLASPVAWAENGVLVVHVRDVQQRPVAGLQIGVEGDGGSAITDPKGRARIKLAPQTREKAWFTFGL